jgi:hypothetical protein
MSHHKQLLANLSHVVYTDDPDRRNQQLAPTAEFQSWYVDQTLSNDTTLVVYNPSLDQVHIAHSGTRLHDKHVKNTVWDLLHDSMIGVGGQAVMPRVALGIDHTKQVQQRYPSATITHTGHSLGGTIATEIGRVLHQDSVVFNPGVSPTEVHRVRNHIYRGWIGHQDSATHIIYRTDRDLVSGSSVIMKYAPSDATIITDETVYTDPHSIRNFSNLQTE